MQDITNATINLVYSSSELEQYIRKQISCLESLSVARTHARFRSADSLQDVVLNSSLLPATRFAI